MRNSFDNFPHTFEVVKDHLSKQVKKYHENRNDFRGSYTLDPEKPSFGTNTQMVFSIVVSQLLRNGIAGMDNRGYVTWENLKGAFSEAVSGIRSAMHTDSGFAAATIDGFYTVLEDAVNTDSLYTMILNRVIFMDQEPGTYENCGRGGRYGSVCDDNTLLVRARYGHTTASGLRPSDTSDIDRDLADESTLVHGTTMDGFWSIMESPGIFSGTGNAVMMERMPAELGHFLEYVQQGRHDESRGGLKDPVSVAMRHLPDVKKGTVVLIETVPRKDLDSIGVKIYTANPPAEMYQVVYRENLQDRGVLGVPVNALARFHLFSVHGEQRDFLGSAESPDEVKRMVYE